MEDTLLVVDDVLSNRRLLKKILEKSGFNVREAKSGEECLEMCESELPALILLDVKLTGMSGYEVCERLRRYYSQQELPIVMVTGSTDSKEIAYAFSIGANDHIGKPIDRSVLLARVNNQLAFSRAQRELQVQRHKIRRSLEIQRAMGDNLPEAIAVEDAHGDIVYANKQFTQICSGVTPRCMSIAFDYLFGGLFHDELISVWTDMTESKIAHREEEFRALNDHRKVMHLVAHQIQSRDQEQLRLWIIRDISNTRALEEAVSQRVKFETLGTFSSGVAHNFNNILGGILGATELLKRMTTDDKKAERYVKLIQQSVDGGKGLTRKLASMVRKNTTEYGEKIVNIEQCIDTLVECLREVTGDRIRFVTHISPNLPGINITETNFIDVFANVLSNAIDSIVDEGEITVSAHLSQDGAGVEVLVQDSGRGMDIETQRRIFEPFFSTKNLDHKNGVSCQGNGLGLWTVYNLVKGSEGDIDIESTQSTGTLVKIVIPKIEQGDSINETIL